MAFERTARAFVLALGITGVVSAALPPQPALACSCPERGASVLWPLPGAVDVPIDTPLVFARYDLGGSTEAIGYALLAPDGHEVALTEQNRLPAAYLGCDAFETLFLRPNEPLDAYTEYRLVARHVDAAGEEASASFTTSSERATPEAPEAATLEYLRVTTGSCENGNCLALAEALVALEAKPAAPRWLVLDSAALEHAHNAHVFRTDDESPDAASWQLSVLLPRIDPCIDVALYGIEGVVLWEQRRCDPDRCARTDGATFNFCGGPPFSGIRAADIAEGSCSAPPTIEQGAPPPAAPPPAQASSCHVQRPGSGERGTPPSGPLAALLLWAATRHGRGAPAAPRATTRARRR